MFKKTHWEPRTKYTKLKRIGRKRVPVELIVFCTFLPFSCGQGCVSAGSELCWPAQGPLLPQGQGRQWVCHQRPDCAAGEHAALMGYTSIPVFVTSGSLIHCICEGVQRSGRAGQGRLREDVPVDGHPHQPAAGHQAAPAVLHRGLGHRWLWNLWCELGAGWWGIL